MADPTPTAPAPTREPILDLDLLTSGGFVKLFGETHRVKSPDRVPPLQRHYIVVASKRVTEIEQKTEQLTEAERTEYSTILDQITRYVLDAPEAFHARLDDLYREDICKAFSVLPLASLGLAGAIRLTEAPMSSRTGASSSPGSAGSTAATPGAGSRKSRAASSRRAR